MVENLNSLVRTRVLFTVFAVPILKKKIYENLKVHATKTDFIRVYKTSVSYFQT